MPISVGFFPAERLSICSPFLFIPALFAQCHFFFSPGSFFSFHLLLFPFILSSIHIPLPCFLFSYDNIRLLFFQSLFFLFVFHFLSLPPLLFPFLFFFYFLSYSVPIRLLNLAAQEVLWRFKQTVWIVTVQVLQYLKWLFFSWINIFKNLLDPFQVRAQTFVAHFLFCNQLFLTDVLSNHSKHGEETRHQNFWPLKFL